MALTDYLRASDGNGESVRCIVVDARGVGDMVFNNTTPTNWSNHFVAMAGTVGSDDRFIEGQYVVFKGHLDGSAITIEEFAPGYVDIGNQEEDIIVIKPTTLWADIVADTMDGVEQAIEDAEDAADAATTAAQGAALLSGTGAPSSGLGYDGNWYLDTATDDLYKKASGSWTLMVNIKGAPGANGSTWYAGSGAPSGGTGANGDFYWRTDTYQVYQKSGGSWSVITTIPTGIDLSALTAKTTPVDADLALLADSAASFANKKLTFANLWAWISGKISSMTNWITGSMIQDNTIPPSKLDWATLDTGWVNMSYGSGYTAGTAEQLKYRVIGRTVYITGGAQGTFATGVYQQVTSSPLPAAFRPPVSYRGGAMGAGMRGYCGVEVQASGHILLGWANGGGGLSAPGWIGTTISYPLDP